MAHTPFAAVSVNESAPVGTLGASEDLGQRRESYGLVSRSFSKLRRQHQELDGSKVTGHLWDISQGQRVKKNLPWEHMPLIINFDRKHK